MADIILKKWFLRHGGYCDSLSPHQFQVTGRGMIAKETIQPGNVLISLSESLMISRGTVLRSTIGQQVVNPESLSTHVLLANYLVHLVCDNTESDALFWNVYVKSLPRRFENSVYMTPEELEKLPRLHFQTASELVAKISRDFNVAVGCWPRTVQWKYFKWAWCVVNTRSVHVATGEDPSGQHYCLLPYFDLLNHSPLANCEIVHKLGRTELVTNDSYSPGDQVFIRYGCHSDWSLLLEYGFITSQGNLCVEFTDAEVLAISSRCSSGSPKNCFSTAISRVVAKYQIGDNIFISDDGPSWSLMCLLECLAAVEPTDGSVARDASFGLLDDVISNVGDQLTTGAQTFWTRLVGSRIASNKFRMAVVCKSAGVERINKLLEMENTLLSNYIN